MKKAVSLLLSILLIVVVLPMGIFGVTAADQTFTNGNFTYKVVNDEAIIVSAAEGLSGALVIPSELDGYTVTAIGPKAFYNFKNLTEVTIPSTIKSMGKNAFMNCTGMTKINITDLKAWCEMERFGALASPMIYAKKLYLNGALVEGNITIPEGTKAITQGAFYSCKDIKNVTLPNTITYIGESAFDGCEYLASINIPNSVTEIGDWAFTGCKRLSSISIPSSVTKIGEGTFYYAQWLETIDLPDTITYIGPSAFDSTDFYYSLPYDVVYIGKVLYACRGECPTNLVVKEGTVSIADKAFGDAGYINSGYSELESVTIPSSVKYIGESAFYNCSNLAQVNFDGNLDYLGKHAFGNTAWYNAKPDGMVYVGNFAYKYKGECPEQVTITDGTAGITAWAFQNCSILSKINIPSSVKYIGDSAFYGCSNLENINIASSSQLKSMPLSAIEQTKWYKNKDYGPVYAGNVLLAYKLPYGEDGPREIVLNNDTVGVVDSVFMNCMVLSSLTFSKNLTNILPHAFDYTYIDTINFKGTRNDWQAMSYSNCRQLAGTHVVCTCTGAHSFDNDADTTCNNCDYIRTVAANEEFVVTAGGGTAARGGTITVPIVVENNPGWRALDIRVAYDADVLEIQCPNHDDSKNCTGPRKPIVVKKDDFEMAEAYECANSGVFPNKHTANPYPLTWAYATIEEDITETGTYASITFVVKDDAALGETKVDIEVLTITNCNFEHPTATANDGIINIVDKHVNTNIPCDPNLEKATATSVTLAATQGYEYSMDGTTWQTSNVFNNLAPNTEYTFYQRIAETDTHFASAISEKLVVKTIKHNAADPVAPVEKSKTVTSVTLVAAQGYEYSIDGETWQTSNVFNNLAPNTEYTFYQRVAETDTHYASVVSTPLVVTTNKYNNVAFPIAPVEKSKTATSVTLVAVEGYEYSLDGETWQSSNVFESLMPNTEHTFYQRIAETDTYYASSPSAPLVVKTIKHNAAAPVAPVEESKTATSVTLVAVEGYEYSVDGETWQTSNVFENLAPDTEYTFYQRVAETDTHYASVVSEKLAVKTIKHTASTPISPVIASKEATVIILAAQQGYEYSIDGEAWQISNVFENLTPGTTYTFYQRVAETDTHYASETSVGTTCTTLKLQQAAPVAPVVLKVEATTVTLLAKEGYEYSLDGEFWQTSNVFENLDPNTEYTFYQRKAETDTHYVSVPSAPLVVKTIKHTAENPVAPETLEITATTITLVAVEGYEYSLDGETWQTSNVFENLASNTEYTFYQRIAETNTHYASAISEKLVVKTIKHNAASPVVPIEESKTATTVTLVAVEGYEYSLDGETWQTSNVFENLASNTEYTFYQRIAETNTHYASAVSEKLVVKTIKHNAAAPVVPVEESKAATSVTLVAVEGYEYSMDGENWQTSNVFNNLDPNTEYTFYQRIAETNTHYVSAVSEKLVVKTIKHNAFAPNQPVVASKDATVVVLVSQSGCEYSLDGENWQTSNVFENLAPGTTYTFYQRVAETGTHYASKASGGTTCTTLKLQQTAPVAPVASMVEATTVTLVAKEGYEYSLDGEIWQTSNVFENLAPNTEYTFYQRKAETDTHYASVPSTPLVVKTIKHTAETPVAPETLEITATTVTLVAMDGYEYSLDGEDWQTSNVFETLAPNTEYTFYQRKAETNTHYASVLSAPLVVKTIKHTAENPIAPETLEITATTVTLVAMDGYEYSLDGETWQSSNVFKNLAPNTEYSFYQRKAETETHYASEISAKLVVNTYISGNVNNDDEVTLDDVVLLAQYVAGWDVELNLNVSDVNGDTDITLDDVVLLAQFVAGWDVTLN